MKKSYDVVVIGSGPGGYVSALRCAQLGRSALCVERRQNGDKVQPGGTCLNVGCIPSKALLDSSHHYASLRQLAAHGIDIKGQSFDLQRMMARKLEVIETLGRGVAGLLKAAGAELIGGCATLLPGRRVRIDDKREVEAGAVILAPGSEPASLSVAAMDGRRIVDSSAALAFDKTPKKLAIIGAGVIGLELGSVWARLGSEVVIVEALETFLPMLDRRLANEAKRIFEGQGLDIRLGCEVVSAKASAKGVKLNYTLGGEKHEIGSDMLIVAVGRRAAVNDAVADESLKIDEAGRIEVDEFCATSVDGVYAIGDAVRGPMLAHKAMDEGVMVAERICGKLTRLNYDLIPGVIYTHPEIAWVGPSETELKAAGREIRSGEFPFAAIGRALASGESEGMVRLHADAETDRLLSCQIIGPGAADLTQQAALAMELCASAEDVAMTICAHPTFSEGLREAALAVDQRALHMPMRRGKRG